MEVKEAVQTLVKALKEDEGYRIGWQANIAMAFVDEHARRIEKVGEPLSNGEIHAVANEAANHFLNVLCMDASS